MKERLVELIRSGLDKHESTIENYVISLWEFLADYLLENGAIVPPCKVGDKVYFVFEDIVLDDEILLIEVTESEIYLSTCSKRYLLKNGCLYSEMLDETAYFTREEAEKTLAGEPRERRKQ